MNARHVKSALGLLLCCVRTGAVSGAEFPDELHQLWRTGDRLHRPQDHRRPNADFLHTQGMQGVNKIAE